MANTLITKRAAVTAQFSIMIFLTCMPQLNHLRIDPQFNYTAISAGMLYITPVINMTSCHELDGTEYLAEGSIIKARKWYPLAGPSRLVIESEQAELQEKIETASLYFREHRTIRPEAVRELTLPAKNGYILFSCFTSVLSDTSRRVESVEKKNEKGRVVEQYERTRSLNCSNLYGFLTIFELSSGRAVFEVTHTANSCNTHEFKRDTRVTGNSVLGEIISIVIGEKESKPEYPGPVDPVSLAVMFYADIAANLPRK